MNLLSLKKILIIIFIINMNSDASATDIPIQFSYLEWAKKADKIVIAKLISKKLISSIGTKEKEYCGWALEFEVIKSWKGGKEKFNFFVTNYDSMKNTHDVINDIDKEYLLFAIRRPQGYQMNFSCDSKEIDLSKYLYFTTYPDQLIFKVTRDEHNKFDNGWLVLARRQGHPPLSPNCYKEEYKKNFIYTKVRNFVQSKIRIPFFISCVINNEVVVD